MPDASAPPRPGLTLPERGDAPLQRVEVAREPRHPAQVLVVLAFADEVLHERRQNAPVNSGRARRGTPPASARECSTRAGCCLGGKHKAVGVRRHRRGHGGFGNRNPDFFSPCTISLPRAPAAARPVVGSARQRLALPLSTPWNRQSPGPRGLTGARGFSAALILLRGRAPLGFEVEFD